MAEEGVAEEAEGLDVAEEGVEALVAVAAAAVTATAATVAAAAAAATVVAGEEDPLGAEVEARAEAGVEARAEAVAGRARVGRVVDWGATQRCTGLQLSLPEAPLTCLHRFDMRLYGL